jgi:hypothetical protein
MLNENEANPLALNRHMLTLLNHAKQLMMIDTRFTTPCSPPAQLSHNQWDWYILNIYIDKLGMDELGNIEDFQKEIHRDWTHLSNGSWQGATLLALIKKETAAKKNLKAIRRNLMVQATTKKLKPQVISSINHPIVIIFSIQHTSAKMKLLFKQ